MSDVIKFGTDGWRAIIAEDFTFANVERVAYAVGVYVKRIYHCDGAGSVPILIGYDTRFLADKFAHRAAQVLIGMGIPTKVSDRDVPTPCIAWATQHEPTAGALQFTASHNPPEYCGIKYIPHYAGPATDEITNSLLSHLSDIPDDYEAPGVNVPTFDPKPPYLAALHKLIDFKKIGASGLKIGYDALYSTSRDYLDKVLIDAGLKVTVLHNWRDTTFGGGMPEPKEQYLTELMETVRKEKLDIGLATDGDADRFAVIDELGHYLSPNHLLCLLTRHLVKNHGKKGTVVRTVATTHLLDRLAEMYGLDIEETPVGFKYIGEKMRDGNVLLGGEESGGFSFHGHIPEKDGILANLLVVEMLAYEGKPLSQIWKDLTAEAGMEMVFRRADLNFSKRIQKELMERLETAPMSKLAGHAVTKVGRKDGLKLYLDHHNWMLIRPSGTEPLIRLYFEGTSAEKADSVMADFNVQIDKIVAELDRKPAAKEAASRH
jgi:alpha-D-glucose phosphate-specific phosphoglucomutase